MADYGTFEKTFFGGAVQAFNTDDGGTNDFEKTFEGGIVQAAEETSGSGPGPGGGGDGGLFFCNG